MATRGKREEKVKRSKEDTWRSEELTKELGKKVESDKMDKRKSDKNMKQRSPFKGDTSTSSPHLKDKTGKHMKVDGRHKDKQKEIKKEKEGGKPEGRHSDRGKERILKETQSPKINRNFSPKLKEKNSVNLKTQSPLHTRKKRGTELDKVEDKRGVSISSSRSPQHSKQPKDKKQDVSHKKPLQNKEHMNMEQVVPMEEVIEDISQLDEQQGIRGNNGGYSDEEFDEENYEEDFEEIIETSSDDQSINIKGDITPQPPLPTHELDDIMNAINTENKDVDLQLSSNATPEPSAPSSHALFSPCPKMSFTTTSPTQTTRVSAKTARKMRTRADELSRLITIDVMGATLFEMNPQSEYDFYMRSFGTNNTHQTGTQTGCDHEEIDTQTDDITYIDRWTQCPPHDLKGFGGCYPDGTELLDEDNIVQYSTESFIKFIEKSGKLILDLLEEEGQTHGVSQQKSQYTSDPYCTLKASFERKMAATHSVTCMDWRPANTNLYLIGYDDNSSGGDWTGTLELWNGLRPSTSQHILGDHSTPTACCLLFPLVLAGNADGSIVVWDLREPLSMHRTAHKDKSRIHRVPTFTTAALGWDSGHCESVLCMSSTSTGISDHGTEGHTGRGLSSQVLSVDSSGKVCVWVIVEVMDPDPAGSDTDLGLVPGGKIKLIASSSFRIFDPSLASPCISCVCVKDINSNSLLVGTDNGEVVCHVRYKVSSSTKTYSLESIHVNQRVTSISIHPILRHHFLVGYSTGHIALYHTNKPHPLYLWPPLDTSVHSLHWHPQLPNVFIGVWGETSLYIWSVDIRDLLQNDASPIHKLNLESKIISVLPVTSHDDQPSMVISLSSGVSNIFYLKASKLHDKMNNLTELLSEYFISLF